MIRRLLAAFRGVAPRHLSEFERGRAWARGELAAGRSEDSLDDAIDVPPRSEFDMGVLAACREHNARRFAAAP